MIYITGDTSGENIEQTKEYFNKAKAALRGMNIKKIACPFDLGIPDHYSPELKLEIRKDTIDKCMAVYLLDNWRTSQEAKEEFYYAVLRRKPIFFEESNDISVIARYASTRFMNID